MEPSERICTFPIMGKKNSLVVKGFLESLDLKVLLPPPTTDETIKKGVKHCASMVCYPLKTTLGNYIEALELGANTLLAYDTKGRCRFRQYNKLHEFTLTGLGYEFEMFVVSPRNFVSVLHKLSGNSRLNVLRKLYGCFSKLQQNDTQQWSQEKPNIGIIGEIYVINHSEINYGLERKIRGFDCNPYNTATATDFLQNTVPLFDPLRFLRKDKKRPYKRQAMRYLNGQIGGHAFENLYNLLELREKGVDGVVHILPLSCTAETTIEPYVDHICREGRIPLLRIPIDENSAEANLDTRLETFCELIKINRGNEREWLMHT